MRELFKTDKHVLRAADEPEVFEWYDKDNNKVHALDKEGNEITGYKRPEMVLDEAEQMEGEMPDDPTAIGCVTDGLYPYSTHPVEWHIGDCYGIIGFKDLKGNIVIKEQYEQVDDSFYCGWISVKKEDTGWGCIDKKGDTVISFSYGEPVRFNRYGVAEGDNCLIDVNEKKIDGTELNFADCDVDDRYYIIALLSDEACRSIDDCGQADDLTVDVYDTKTRSFVVKGVPDCKLQIYEFGDSPEPEVIKKAVQLLSEYDKVTIEGAHTIIAEKAGVSTIFDNRDLPERFEQ